MITAYTTGGLGNQLFNYAAARSLADRNKVRLLIDASTYRSAPISRPFLLDCFPKLRALFRNRPGLAENTTFTARLVRLIREGFLAKQVIRSNESVAYFPEFELLGKRVVFRGHYIDRRFFAWNESQLRSDLSLPDDFLEKRSDRHGMKVYEKIHKTHIPVSVHVRRGDFLEPYASWLLLPKIELYYHKAMACIEELLNAEVQFWVFSDSIEWCKKAFADFPYRINFVDQFVDAEKNALREFFLMSSCQHHIITNSGFSLWSAWLNLRSDKIVIAPYQWDRENRTNIDHLIPSQWKKIYW